MRSGVRIVLCQSIDGSPDAVKPALAYLQFKRGARLGAPAKVRGLVRRKESDVQRYILVLAKSFADDSVVMSCGKVVAR
jgi:hypothetical protein